MASRLCITVYNTFPDAITDGPHIPFHSVFIDPFTKPLIIGNRPCGSKTSVHVGFNTDEAIAGTFVGVNGDFLVCKSERFVFFSPTAHTNVTLENALCPSPKTHAISQGKEGKTHQITAGSSILAYTENGLASISIFFGILDNISIYSKVNQFLLISLAHFIRLWKVIFTDKQLHTERFKIDSVTTTTVPLLNLQMHAANRLPTAPKPATAIATIKPVDAASILESMKRKAASDGETEQPTTAAQIIVSDAKRQKK